MDGEAVPKKNLQSLLKGFISKKAKTVAATKPPAPPPGFPPNTLKRQRSDSENGGDGNPSPRAMAPSRNLHVSNISPTTTER
jgi:hypothetical protein